MCLSKRPVAVATGRFRGLEDGDSRARRLLIFRSLAGNRALVRVVVAYALFIVTEFSEWLAMLVYAYRQWAPR